ncbi:hypothetical protein JCM4814A_74160 [Streptomyces phaeofaciens JCM 4814]|uniref:Uncharacterized protein n=1 Tax=Streptomyces phaeofaciens TaxID=68254 RepID=A0A918HI36_9ACTN|nr:hypothetical protein [Streptomyces phaeofaciens]GGT63648.1 hypothetical protein GCM10010226_46620 [Streptomyces phaeofaciens]
MDTTPRTDDELAGLDIAALLRYGLTAAPGPLRTSLFGDGAVGAAVLLDRAGTEPRSVAYLADTVRAGGPAHAAALPEPLPRPPAAALVREWLEAAASVAPGPEAGDTAARWLRSVATIMEVRQRTRG